MNQPAHDTPAPHPMPLRQFNRWEDAYNWLSDHGWREVKVRGSHFRMEHPDYSRPLFLIHPHDGWEKFQQLQLIKHLRKLDRCSRRETGSG